MLSQELRDGINCKVMFKEIRYLSEQMPACWLLSSSINTVMAEYKQDDMLSMDSKFDLRFTNLYLQTFIRTSYFGIRVIFLMRLNFKIFGHEGPIRPL